MAQETSKTSKFLKAVLSTVITLVLLWAVLYIQNNYFNKPDPVPAPIPDPDPPVVQVIDEDGIYTSKEDVALYIHTYNKLPKNFITKKQAKKYGWSSGGLDKYYENGCIGGDVSAIKRDFFRQRKAASGTSVILILSIRKKEVQNALFSPQMA